MRRGRHPIQPDSRPRSPVVLRADILTERGKGTCSMALDGTGEHCHWIECGLHP